VTLSRRRPPTVDAAPTVGAAPTVAATPSVAVTVAAATPSVTAIPSATGRPQGRSSDPSVGRTSQEAAPPPISPPPPPQPTPTPSASSGRTAPATRIGSPKGRPRNPDVDQAIIRVTVELLAERGYSGLTVDEIAQRAHVGKATIYRRWPSKLPLVIEAVRAVGEEQVATPDSGTVQSDVLEVLESFIAALHTPLGRALVRLLADAAPDPSLRHIVYEELILRRQTALRVILERGIAKHELREDADLDLALELGTAALLHRLVVSDRPLDVDYATRVAELLLKGLAPPG